VITLAEVLRRSTEYLESRGSPTPRLDAELLLSHGLALSRLELYTQFDRPLTDDELTACRELVRRRGAREPVAYVIGHWGFRRLDLAVDARVLVPRPETELVVERTLAAIAGARHPAVLDLGTGSGAIALAVADEHPGALVTGLDASEGALEVARANAERTGLPLELVEHDLRAGLPDGPWDLVVSNPPYVRPDEIEALEPEVRDWEPRDALVGVGATGAVVHGATSVLAAGGALVLEIADGTAEEVARLLEASGYTDVRATLDLARRERVVEGARG
jgi:release factor glutamine methyltransferase